MSNFYDDMEGAYLPSTTRVGNSVTRWSAADERPAEVLHHSPALRVGSGTVRFTANGNGFDAEEVGGVARATASHAGTVGGSRAVTLQHVGTSQSVELEPGNPASRTDVKTAERMGLIRRNSAGAWEDVGASTYTTTQQPQTQQQPAEEPSPEAAHAAQLQAAGIEPAEAARWQAMVDPLPQAAFDLAQARMIAAVAAGSFQGLEDAATALHQTAGVSHEEARALINAGFDFHATAISRVLGRVGVTDADALAGWARANDPHMLTHSLQQLVVAANPAPLRSLAVRFQTQALKGGAR